ncbi:hypothetical protein E2C01_029193 [Portunus trituberculatus]|uniref:Uncharacterized protein n=1 Tax=Portunus trituberculatus TaxID=210409 RepID=A0A5B7ER55_PORTR|nr:hypothetical protein [Portunus trituberculatus]
MAPVPPGVPKLLSSPPPEGCLGSRRCSQESSLHGLREVSYGACCPCGRCLVRRCGLGHLKDTPVLLYIRECSQAASEGGPVHDWGSGA